MANQTDLHTEENTTLRTKPYLRPTWIETASKLLTLAGVVAAAITTAVFINGLTQAGAGVDVLTTIHDDTATAVEDAFREALPVTETGVAVTADTTSRVTLEIWDSTVLEQALSHLHVLLAGIAIFVGSVLVGRIMRNIAVGDPFAPGTSRNFAALASIVGVFSLVQSIPGVIASNMALDRAGLLSDFSTPANFDPFGIIVAPFVLLVLAEAFRAGGRLRSDTEGLI